MFAPSRSSRRPVRLLGLAALGMAGSLLPALAAPPAVSRPPVRHGVAPPPAALGAVSPSDPGKPDPIMPLSEVRAGMKGYGLTVFRGTKIERFGVDVLGVLPRMNAGRSLILVRFSGGPITERGALLIKGMSGSPIYVDGKLLGAFAYANPFPKEPIGMVTPIEDMLEALDPKLPDRPAGETPPAISAAGPGESPLIARPMGLPVMISGVSPRVLRSAAASFRGIGLEVMQGPGAAGEPLHTQLVPGAAVGVALMTGDVDVTALGTITYRRGNQILAFGHPWLQVGATEFPLTTATIHEIFPAVESSFKIGSAGEIVGTLTQDRPFGVAGSLGKMPSLIPVQCRVDDRTTGRTLDLQCRAARHPMLIGQLIPMALTQAISQVRPVPGDTMARVQLEVVTRGAGTIRRENTYYDPIGTDLPAVRELAELLNILATNPFHRVSIERVSISVSLEDGRPTATLERLSIPREIFRPGDEVPVTLGLRQYRGQMLQVQTTIRVPETAGEGRAVLLVSGGATRVNLGSIQNVGGGTPGPAPDAGIEDLVRRYTSRERGNQLAVRLILPSVTLNANGIRLSGLPSHMVERLRASLSTGLRQERETVLALRDSGYIVDGLQTLAVSIERDRHQEPGRVPAVGGTAAGAGVSLPAPPPPGSAALVGDDFDAAMAVPMGWRRVSVPLSVDGRAHVLTFLTPEIGEDGAEPGQRATTPRPAGPLPAAPPAPDPPSTLVGRQTQTWSQSSMAEFSAGVFRGTSLATTGEVRLAPSLKVVAEITAGLAWCTAGSSAGVFLGSAEGGRVERIGPAGASPRSMTYCRLDDTAVTALCADSQDTLYAGTMPAGRLVKIDTTGKATTLFDLAAQSSPGTCLIDAIALGRDGVLYAGGGTSEGAIILRVNVGASRAEVFTRLPGRCVTSLAVSPAGTLYAGTGEDGVIHAINPSGGAQALADTDQAVITGLAIGADGRVYAAAYPSGMIYRLEAGGKLTPVLTRARGALFGLVADRAGNLYAPGSGFILRVGPDGTGEILRDPGQAPFTALAWAADGNLVVAAGYPGRLFRLSPNRTGEYESPVRDARAPAVWGRVRFSGIAPEQATVRLQTRSGAVAEPDDSWSEWEDPLARDGSNFVASPPNRYLQYRLTLASSTGTPAIREVAISYLPRNQAPRLTPATPAPGELLRGRATLKWSADDPDGDTLSYTLSISGDGGATWKPLTEATPGGPDAGAIPPAGASAPAGPTRESADQAVEQYRRELEKDRSLTQEQRDENLKRARELILKYFAERGTGSEPTPGAPTPGTPALPAPVSGDGATTRATFIWDTRTVPDGIYQLRIVADDGAANPGDPLSDLRISEPFVVVNTPPDLFLFERGIQRLPSGEAEVTGFVAGRVGVRGAQFRIEGGPWRAIAAEDGLWDGAFERFRFSLPASAEGKKVEVLTLDAAGNPRSATLTLPRPVAPSPGRSRPGD